MWENVLKVDSDSGSQGWGPQVGQVLSSDLSPDIIVGVRVTWGAGF